LPVGFALMMLQALSELIKRIAALRGRYSLEHGYEMPLQ
jgi:TRAP-type mannitol/chloroaromatic compound transport system permease small subunit